MISPSISFLSDHQFSNHSMIISIVCVCYFTNYLHLLSFESDTLYFDFSSSAFLAFVILLILFSGNTNHSCIFEKDALDL